LTPHTANLHTKLMLALAVLVALVAGGSAYFLIEQERELQILELEGRATRIVDLLSRSLAHPLWNVDRKEIDGQLAALAPNPEVAQFSVTAVNYGPVSTVTGAGGAAPVDGIVRVRAIEYAPFADSPAQKIGEVRIVLTRAVTERKIAHARRAILAIMAAIVAALYAATFVLLKRMVRRPINRLEEMVDRIADGDLDARGPVESGDELGRLAQRVNAMADRRSRKCLRCSRLRPRSMRRSPRRRISPERRRATNKAARRSPGRAAHSTPRSSARTRKCRKAIRRETTSPRIKARSACSGRSAISSPTARPCAKRRSR
jgi:HAMP domain-containing protein